MLYTIPLRVSKNKMYVQVYVTICLNPTPVFVSELECQEVQFWILPLDGSVSNKSRPCSRLFDTDKNVQQLAI